MPFSITRRRFLQSAAAAPVVLSASSRGTFAAEANDRINLGFIGVGRMGKGHARTFLRYGDVQIVAVCDVVAERRDDVQKIVNDHYASQKSKGSYRGCDVYNDLTELLARDDIDAVVIGTPDHWHAPAAILAARSGKDIYCEKPLTHVISDGRRLVEEVVKSGVIFQTGSQQRSEFGGKFRQAVELVRNGRLGKIHTVRVGVGGPAVPCDLPDQQAPEGTDWDRWLGAAPWRGYHEILCPKGVHSHFPAWRKYREYAGGGLADMGAHHFDIAQWALDMDDSGPTLIEPPDDPKATSGLKFTYASGVTMHHGGPSGCTFEGERGRLYVDRGKIESDPAEILSEPLSDDAARVYHSDNHRRNWLDCVRSRKAPICPVETGHRSATICNLGNIGYWLGRKLRWDPASERFLDDDEANRELDREAREGWKV